MPFLPDISVNALPGNTPEEKMESLIRQVNEWGRLLSNEKRTDVYKDNSGTNRILIGLFPDNEAGIIISKEGTEVQNVFD